MSDAGDRYEQQAEKAKKTWARVVAAREAMQTGTPETYRERLEELREAERADDIASYVGD